MAVTWNEKGSLKGPKGDKGDTGEQGPQGEKGDKGDKGDTGAAGPGVSVGSGVPSSAGQVGECYIDISTGKLYRYEESGD